MKLKKKQERPRAVCHLNKSILQIPASAVENRQKRWFIGEKHIDIDKERCRKGKLRSCVQERKAYFICLRKQIVVRNVKPEGVLCCCLVMQNKITA